MKIAVLIVSWESENYVDSAIASVIEQLNENDKIVVWDNASSPSSQEHLKSLKQRWPAIDLHLSPDNLGFARGNNAAAELCSDADAFLTLNPDAILEQGAVLAMRQALESAPDIGAVGAIQLSDDKQTIDGLGDQYHLSGLAWRAGYGRRSGPELSRPAVSISDVADIFSPCAAVALYRSAAFVSSGGFDADYFCYCEDNDLGFRLRLNGWRCVRANKALARHVGSTSLGKDSDFAVYHGQRNMVWTFVKNMPGVLLPLLLPVHLLANLVLITVYCARGKPSVILRAKKDALRGLKVALRKRQQIQQSRKSSIGQIWHALNKSIIR